MNVRATIACVLLKLKTKRGRWRSELSLEIAHGGDIAPAAGRARGEWLFLTRAMPSVTVGEVSIGNAYSREPEPGIHHPRQALALENRYSIVRNKQRH